MLHSNLNKFYHHKRIFVTGHTGFKGSWLCHWLSLLGAKVYGYALPAEQDSLFNKLNLCDHMFSYMDDIRDKKALLNATADVQPDMVFHLAAQSLVRQSYNDPTETFDVNVMGSINVLESIRAIDTVKALIYVTSDKCYQNNEWVWGYRESDPLGGNDPYSASKACAEHVFKSYYLSFLKDKKNFNCASVRSGNVIGGGDYSKDRIVPDIIKAIQEQKNIVLRNPYSTRPWQHVLDPLHGYLILAQKIYENVNFYPGESWNFGPSDQSVATVLTLTQQLIKNVDNINIDFDDSLNPHEASLLHLASDKALRFLNWSTTYDFNRIIHLIKQWHDSTQNDIHPRTITTEQINNFMQQVSKTKQS